MFAVLSYHQDGTVCVGRVGGILVEHGARDRSIGVREGLITTCKGGRG